ncbi:nuclear transport factor 2 family protein [Streptomyces sp. NPDC001852]|uniref:nuclear transport factor 2 family protein n=1 Tax=Streptomyces sp. NPDC001852 TaxID=3364619 RepID=UPI0036BF9819
MDDRPVPCQLTIPKEKRYGHHCDALPRGHTKKSADALAALYAEDAVHEAPFTVPGFPPRFKGREAIRAAYGAMWNASPVVIDSVDTTALHRTSDEEVVVVEQRTRGHVGPEEPAFGVTSLLGRVFGRDQGVVLVSQNGWLTTPLAGLGCRWHRVG